MEHGGRHRTAGTGLKTLDNQGQHLLDLSETLEGRCAMTAIAPSPGGTTASDPKVARWTRWSLWMLPTFLVAFLVTSIVGEYVMLPWLGLNEGDLMLMDRGMAGWVSEVAFALVLVTPAVFGVIFAIAALRRSGRWPAWVGLILNALLVAFVIYMFVDAIHMTYDPQGAWLRF
jgi:hypothetical protein